MSEETHNQKAQRLFEGADINDSQATPYTFEWEDNMPPRILDKDGNCAAIISTGTIKGAYSTKTIIATAKRLMNGNGAISPYGYGFKLKKPEQKIFVIAENIADAMDKVTEKFPDRDWEMINHSSVEVIE